MITVINSQTIDATKTLAKWSPILQNLKIQPELHEVLATYCEMHAILETASMSMIADFPGLNVRAETPPEFSHNHTMLPEALKVITQLNLQGKNVQITASPNFYYIEENQCKQAQIGSMTFDASFEGVGFYSEEIKQNLIQQLVDQINEQLTKYDTIVLYMLVTNISAMSAADKQPKICLTSRYAMFDPINPKDDFRRYTTIGLSDCTNEELLTELSKRLNPITSSNNTEL